MKSFVVLALFAILSSALAVHLSPKQSAFVALKEELKTNKAPLARTISSLLALQQHINDNSEIIQALDVLRNELTGILSKTEGLYSQATGNHESENAGLEAHLGAVEQTLADNQAKLHENEDDLAVTVEAITYNENELTSTIQQLDDARETRVVEHDIFVTQTTDIANSVDALNEAVALVEEILEQDLASTGFEAFIQTSTNKIKAAMSKVEARLKRSRAGASVAPFLKALAQVMAHGVNQQIASTILELLNGAVSDLQDTDKAIRQLEEERLEAFDVLTTELNNRKDLLVDTLNGLRQHQADVEGVIAVLNENIAQNESDIADANEAIETEGQNWANTAARYEQKISRANSDLQLIDRAVARLA